MMPASIVRALTNPAFTAAEFSPTQWDSAEDKAKFANALMKFIAGDFPRQSFTKSLYRRLSNTFGHIAHCDLEGFYGVFFNVTPTKLSSSTRPCAGPTSATPPSRIPTSSGVKRRLSAANVIEGFRMREADAVRRRELATLARLEEKYGARTPPPASDLGTVRQEPSPLTGQGDLFAA